MTYNVFGGSLNRALSIYLERSPLVHRYVFEISRSGLFIKITRSRSRSQEHKKRVCVFQAVNFECFDLQT